MIVVRFVLVVDLNQFVELMTILPQAGQPNKEGSK